MVTQAKPTTAAEFDAFVQLEENRDRSFEYIGGAIVEVVSSEESSEIGLLIGGMLMVFARQHGLGRVTGADGGYMIGGERYIPDVAYSSLQKMPQRTRDAYVPTPPDLVVEVLSPSNRPDLMRVKIANYLAAGVVVWLVDPDQEHVEIYAPGQPVVIVGTDGTLTAPALLPGFALPVRDIFADIGAGE